MLLKQNEERLACILTVYYDIQVDITMIDRAVAHEQFEWL